MSIPAILNPAGLTVVFPDGPRMIVKTAPNFEAAVQAWKAGDQDKLLDLMSPKRSISKFTEGKVVFNDDGSVLFNGEPLQNYVLDKIIDLQSRDLPWRPLARFVEKLLSNTSHRAIKELYKFLETESLPITEDGDFLAYKRVRDDWKDFHTGKILNHVGTFVTEDRATVDDDPDHGCSNGLHAGSLSYVKNFNSGGHLIIVKIDPSDVVSIPREDVRKLRTCKYFVVKEMDSKLVDGPLYDGRTATPIKNGWVPKPAECDCDDDLDDDDFDDLDDLDDTEELDVIEDFEIDDLISDLQQIVKSVVALPIAIDVPLRNVLTVQQFDEFDDIVRSDYGVDVDQNDTLETLAERIGEV